MSRRGVWSRLAAWASAAPPRRDGWLSALGALGLRLGVVAWAAGRFPPAADGHFYQVVAERIARGQGYTWLWPDGVVTYAAHYPVGYPAMLGLLYRVFGALPVVAMLVNAVWGGVMVLAVHRVAARAASRGGALLGAALVGLHPALVAYTPALMTEGVLCALLACLAWLVVAVRDAPGARRRWLLVTLGVLCGMTTLVRPQSVLLAPLLGAFALGGASAGWRRWLGGAVVTTLLTVGVCLPWTARNCWRMDRCVFVSANGGWNLYLGAGPGATGAWVPIEVMGVPTECRNVFGEADKDACFGRAGWRRIGERPWRWLALVPNKLGATFNTAAAASGYLAESNPAVLRGGAKATLSATETVWQRLLLALALVALVRAPGPRGQVRLVLGVLAGLGLLLHPAWPSYVALVLIAALFGRSLLDQPIIALAASAVGVTALTHAVFFGADRYSLVCCGVLAMLAACVLPKPDESPAGALARQRF